MNRKNTNRNALNSRSTILAIIDIVKFSYTHFGVTLQKLYVLSKYKDFISTQKQFFESTNASYDIFGIAAIKNVAFLKGCMLARNAR